MGSQNLSIDPSYKHIYRLLRRTNDLLNVFRIADFNVTEFRLLCACAVTGALPVSVQSNSPE